MSIKENILSSFATTPYLNSIGDFSNTPVDDLVISTIASLCSNLSAEVPLKKKLKKRSRASWYNSAIRALKANVTGIAKDDVAFQQFSLFS